MHTFPQGGALDDPSGVLVSLEAFFLGGQWDTSLQHCLSYLLGVDGLSHCHPMGLLAGSTRGWRWLLVPGFEGPCQGYLGRGVLSKPDTCPFLMSPMQVIWGWCTLLASSTSMYRGTCDLQAPMLGLPHPPSLLAQGLGGSRHAVISPRRHCEEAVLQYPHRMIQPPTPN